MNALGLCWWRLAGRTGRHGKLAEGPSWGSCPSRGCYSRRLPCPRTRRYLSRQPTHSTTDPGPFDSAADFPNSGATSSLVSSATATASDRAPPRCAPDAAASLCWPLGPLERAVLRTSTQAIVRRICIPRTVDPDRSPASCRGEANKRDEGVGTSPPPRGSAAPQSASKAPSGRGSGPRGRSNNEPQQSLGMLAMTRAGFWIPRITASSAWHCRWRSTGRLASPAAFHQPPGSDPTALRSRSSGLAGGRCRNHNDSRADAPSKSPPGSLAFPECPDLSSLQLHRIVFQVLSPELLLPALPFITLKCERLQQFRHVYFL